MEYKCKNKDKRCPSLRTDPYNVHIEYCSVLRRPIKSEEDMEKYSKICDVGLDLT